MKSLCRVCAATPSKYTCARCYIPYCSAACFKQHKGIASTCKSGPDAAAIQPPDKVAHIQTPAGSSKPPDEDPPKSLRPLTTLNWPYVPEASVFPDPLKRDDPKDLQVRQYEAIATSSRIRSILSKHQDLPDLLATLDKLRGPEREEAIQRALQVTPRDIDRWNRSRELDEDTLALRELAEAVEAAIRGDGESALGLDWGD